jgi:hypothetical protein
MRYLLSACCLVTLGCTTGPNYPLPSAPAVTAPSPSVAPVLPVAAMTLRTSVAPMPVYVGTSTLFYVLVENHVPPAPVTYAWNFGDGQSATNNSGAAYHTYASQGVYEARVTVTDGTDRTATGVVTIPVDRAPVVPAPTPPPPVPVPGFVPSLTCTAGAAGASTACNVSVSYKGNVQPSSTITNVDWDYGDGKVSTPTVPPTPPNVTTTHTYPAGAFTVFATVTSNTVDGSRWATIQQAITIK